MACVVGTMIGVPLSKVPLTAVPQRTALSHAFGGLAAGLVGTAKYFLWLHDGELTTFRMAAIGVEVILGYLTLTGSLMAAGKLQEIIPTRPITYPRPERRQPRLAGDCRRRRGAAAVPAGHVAAVSAHHRAVAGVRRAADHPDRRRRHADGDLAPQRLRRAGGRRDGLRAREQGAHHGRGARRIVGPDPVDHHVPRDESIVHQRAVRGVRAGAGAARRRPKRGRSRAGRRATRRICSRTPRGS